MDSYKAFQVSAAGMNAQKARIDAAALNLANINASAAPGKVGFRPVTAVIHAEQVPFSVMVDGRNAAMPRADIVTQSNLAPRLVYEPGHPHADAAGMVAYPAVDHTSEMLTIISATRMYEANLTALQAQRTMMSRALDIGGGQ